LGHFGLDVCGIGLEVCDAANAGWYFGEGDVKNGTLSGAGALPIAGILTTLGKWFKRGDAAADGLKALPPGRGSSVVNNALEPHEIAQANRIVEFRGGEFVGNTAKSFPGIDGYLNGVPASLKAYSGSKPAGVLKHASSAERSAKNAGYSGVELFVDAPGVSLTDLVDFGMKGPLSQIPSQGTIASIYVRTGDGWVLFPG
jgi:hypothetical protein